METIIEVQSLILQQITLPFADGLSDIIVTSNHHDAHIAYGGELRGARQAGPAQDIAVARFRY